MIIKNIKINNFKSIKELKLSCSRFNVFIGEPNTGKSNILESLGLISNMAYFKYLPEEKFVAKEFVRYSNAYNLYYDNDISQVIQITFNEFSIKIKSNESGHHVILHNNKRELWKTTIHDHGLVAGTDLERLHENEKVITNFRKIKFYRYHFVERYSPRIPSFLLPPSGINQLTILQTHPELRDLIGDILKPFELELYLRLAESKIELVRRKGNIIIGFPLNLTAETIQRIIFLLSIIKTNNDSVIIIEEPETHLFPYYIKYVAELIAQNTNNNQYFISTHNPYLLITLLEKIKLTDIAIFATKFEDYTTKVKKLSKEDIEEILDREDPFFNIESYF